MRTARVTTMTIAAAFLALALGGCGNSSKAGSGTGGTTESGGATTGGRSGSGGTTSTDGSGSGGSTSMGGSGSGGTTGTDGPDAGGATDTGGDTGTGGARATGGTAGTGWRTGGSTASSGGVPGAGGRQTGGATTTKGGTSGQNTTTTISFGGTQGQGGATAKQGERFPFPQNVKYPYGVQSTNVSNDLVRSWYENWKKKHLVDCSGNIMPSADSTSSSKVEAQGFAMVAVAYMGDKDVFDKLYEFYKSKTSSCGLSGWRTNCSGVQDSGAATDGDIDVACGLVVAHWQWPSAGYDAKAKSLLTSLRKMLLECSGKWTVYPGCSGNSPWGGCNETDISYYTPAFFRYFAKISGDETWTKLADDTQKIRDAAANASTGLVPDWQSVSGTAGSGSRSGGFGFDAIRAPYKQCLDYLWHGTEAGGAWCKKLSTWAYGVGVDKLKDGYQLSGSSTSNNHNMAAVGSFTIAAMANTQEIADAFVAESVKMKDDYWYSSYLGNLYLLAMSGNMWNPDILGVK
jgi:endoglucanase